MARCVLVLRGDADRPAAGLKEGRWCCGLSPLSPGRSGALGVLPRCANGRRGQPLSADCQARKQSPGKLSEWPGSGGVALWEAE